MRMQTTSTTSVETSLSDNSSEARALACARAAIDKKAENLKCLNLSEISNFTDYFLLANGTSDRQVQAISDAIREAMRAQGVRPISVEGYTEGRWILMDFGDVVIHIFLDALRDYYNLENLWADAPLVKIPSEFYGPGVSRMN